MAKVARSLADHLSRPTSPWAKNSDSSARNRLFMTTHPPGAFVPIGIIVRLIAQHFRNRKWPWGIGEHLSRIEFSDWYGMEQRGRESDVSTAAVASVKRAASHGMPNHPARGGTQGKRRHATAPVNRASPARLRGSPHQRSCGWPVELDTRRLVRPVRRRLIRLIRLAL